MRLDVYGRFQVDVLRTGDQWQVLRLGQGLAAPLDVTIPSHYDEEMAFRFLEDLWHEWAIKGSRLTRIS